MAYEVFGNVWATICGIIIIVLSSLGLVVNRHFWKKEEEESQFRKVNMYINIGTLIAGVLLLVLGIVFEFKVRGGLFGSTVVSS